jgi:pimeloyl-ACP methyl ester carboxylesterase
LCNYPKITLFSDSSFIFPKNNFTRFFMLRASFSCGNSTVSYLVFGSGSTAVVCLHGYGESAERFAFLEETAGDRYTFIAPDLPHHGHTHWTTESLSSQDLQSLITGLIEAQFPGQQVPVYLLGFSLGGRLALYLTQQDFLPLQRIVLLAPDGLKVNPWYWLATQTWAGKQLFAYTMRKPGWFYALLKVLKQLRLVNTSIYKFVDYYIGDATVRQQLYQRWMTLRHIRPSLSEVKAVIRRHRIPTALIYGRYDRIILPVRGEKFRRGVEELVTITLLDAGHQVLHPKHASVIVEALDGKDPLAKKGENR